MANASYSDTVGGMKSHSGMRSANADRLHRGEHVMNNEPTSPTSLCFVLLVDKETTAKNSSSLLNQRSAPKTKKILRGSLLTGSEFPQSRGRGRRLESTYYLVSHLCDDVQFECKSSELARVTFPEMNLLRALSTDSQRYLVHTDKTLLNYALSLKEGCSVRVKLHQDILTGVVRYIGILPGVDSGTLFGVELDKEHRGKGTTDGEFQKKRFFSTPPDSALFVSVHKLIPFDRPDSVPSGEEKTHRPKSTNQSDELASFGEFRVGMTVSCSVGSSYREGKVVSIKIQPGGKEPVFAVEMSGSDRNEPGSSDYKRSYGVKPKSDIKFLGAEDIIPQKLMENQWEEQPEEAPLDSYQVKGKHKGRKSSDPFFLTNNRQKNSSAEKLNKTSKPPGVKRDMSDDLYTQNKFEVHDDSTKYPSYSEPSKGKSSLVNKIKGKLTGKSDPEPSTSKSAQWYGDPEPAKNTLSDKGNMDDDMMKEVTNAIYRDWRTIAFNLYLTKEDLDHIDRKFFSEKDKTEQMLRTWLKQKTGFDKISKLAGACRACNLNNLASELEQGLNEELLMKISEEITEGKCRPLGFNLDFSDAELDWMETSEPNLLPRVRMMLGTWRMAQSYNSDKITLLSRALHNCGLRRLELKVTRGLDDEILSSFAIRIDTNWKILAQNLGLSLNDIIHLEKFPWEKQPYQMLLLWRKRQHRSVDVLGALCKGLKKTGLPDLASDLVQGVTDEMLINIASSVGDRWKALGECLGFSNAELQAIPGGSDSGLTMLKLWRELHDYSSDRLEKLLKALEKCGLDNIANMYRKPELKESQAQKPSLSDVNDDLHVYKELKPKAHKMVTREILMKVSREVDFRDAARALNVSTIDTENLKSANEGRVFEVLDGWRRRGSKGQRDMSELYQVLALIGGKTHLVDDVMRMTAAPNNAEDIKSDTKEHPMEANPPLIDDVSMVEEILYPDLEVNSMVEVTHRIKSYGVIRWIGAPEGSKSKSPVAGIELETPLTNGGTDGTFGKQRYFHCEPHKALFVHLSRCRPDSRFPSQSQTFKVAKRQTSQDFGGFSSPEVPGYIDPPPSLRREFVGMQKGIQGDQNSCYLDTTLFSMFAYNTVFDPLLKRTAGQSDLPLYADVQKILRESIVNPLRKNGFVRADRVLQLREHLDNLGTTKGLMDQEKDPEEFLHTLLSEVFKSKPLLNIRHGASKEVDHSNIYQIFMDKDESFGVPTVEQLLLQSFQDNDLKLTEVPSCLIVQMPRFGKEYKMYKRIVPSLQLDISNILEEHPRQCIVCGNLAVYECKACKSSERLCEIVQINNYCADCFATTHSNKRTDHKPTDLFTRDIFLKDFYAVTMDKGYDEASVDQHRQLMLKPKLMDLFAVICIRTSHYVSFVKAGRENDSEWVFFDSMADRQGDQQGYNIPQITHLKDLRSWVEPKNFDTSEKKQLPELMTRFLGDAYICMYSNSEERKLTYV